MAGARGLPRLCISRRTIDQQSTGVGQYSRALEAGLKAVGMDPEILDEGPPATRSRAVRYIRASLPGARRLTDAPAGLARPDVFREAWVHFKLHRRPLALRAPGPAGIMHWTSPAPMRIAGWRNIYTVHDVIPLHPDIVSPVDGARLRAILESLDRTAARFVTVSEAACDDIRAMLGWRASKVTNCWQAADVGAPDDAPLPAGLRPRGYCVFVGTIEPRKNIARLIAAHVQSGVAVPLVLAGPDGIASAALLAEADPARVVRLPYQSRADLMRLIANARALLFPSLAEGFGLPIAEAMALGVPVMTSAGGATSEVAGDAALLVDPTDVGAMARAIRTLVDDDALCARLSDAGRTRARLFTPDAFGARMAALYEEVAHD